MSSYVLLFENFEDSKYNIIEAGGEFVAIHQGEGPFVRERLRQGQTYYPFFTSDTQNDVLRQLRVFLGGKPKPVPSPLISADDFLNFVFSARTGDISLSVSAALRNRQGGIALIGNNDLSYATKAELERDGHSVSLIPWSFGDPLPKNLTSVTYYVFCLVPKVSEHWLEVSIWNERLGKKLSTVWSLALPFSTISTALNQFEYNTDSFRRMMEFYCGRTLHAPPVELLRQHMDFNGKSVIEFGPSDGVHTGAILNFGAKPVVCVEARPENIIKMLIAKFALGWKDVSIIAENFHSIRAEIHGRFDIAYAHGVYYHTNSPLHFLDSLTRLSDNIFIGGWSATDQFHSPWEEWEFEGQKYRGKSYSEPIHFLSGIQNSSRYLDTDSQIQFFERRGFKTTILSHESNQGRVTGEFLRFLAQRT